MFRLPRSIWPRAIPRITTVNVWLPATPPILATMGMSMASATTLSIESWNKLITAAAIKAVIKLSPKFSFIKQTEANVLEVGAGTLDKTLSRYAAEKSISSFEFLSCIPGSIGGAIMMNSGCYGDEISNILISVKALDFKGNPFKFPMKDGSFKDRTVEIIRRGRELRRRHRKTTRWPTTRTCWLTSILKSTRRSWTLLTYQVRFWSSSCWTSCSFLL